MINFLLPIIFLFLFGFFNLLGIKSSYAWIQLFNFIVGLVVFFITKKLGRNFFKDNARFFYWVFVIILAATYVIGLEVKGSKRWLSLFFFNFQASEFFKFFFIIFLVEYIVENHRKVAELDFFIKLILYFLLPFLIIFKQPDLANAFLYFLTFLVLVLFSGVPIKSVLKLFLYVFLTLPLGWFFLKDYQKSRITSFFLPTQDQAGANYNLIQSIITAGSGQFFGRGLGLGTQSRLHFLPENHTDFAFSALVEQFGFVGGFIVIILFSVLVYLLIKKMVAEYFSHNKKRFLYTLAFLTLLIAQIFINIGMNLGIVPIAGITLPFISYGGSSIVSWLIGLAFLI